MNVRDSILAAGVELLKARGVAALTQPQVARAAGVKQSHLTYYFPRRSDLLLAIAEQSVAHLMDDLAARLVSADDRGAAAQGAVARTIARTVLEGVPPRVMLGLIVAADADPAIRAPLRRLVRQIRARIRAMLERSGVAAGREAALLFHAAVVGLAVMHEARRTTDSANDVRVGVASALTVLGGARGAHRDGGPE